MGYDKNTVSYVADIVSPIKCTNTFMYTGADIGDTINILEYYKEDNIGQFLIIRNNSDIRVILKDFKSGCNETEILNLR